MTKTPVAYEVGTSAVEKATPRLQKSLCILGDQPLYIAQLRSRETAGAHQPDGIEPEFGDVIVTPDMYMGRLVGVSSVKKNRYEPIRRAVGIAAYYI